MVTLEVATLFLSCFIDALFAKEHGLKCSTLSFE